jgi:hypothetical protein
LKIEPIPNPEEVAAIMSALAVTLEDREEVEGTAALRRSRWRLAGLFGHAVPTMMKLEGSLWSYSSWEGMN